MDSQTAIAISGVLVAIGSLAVTVFTARFSARKDEVEAVTMALKSLREDYSRLDGMVNELQVEVSAWRRRFDRVCQQVGVDGREFITRPLGNLGVGE